MSISATNPINHLKRGWIALAIVHITLIFHIIIYRLTPDTGQSTSFLLLASLTIIWSLLIIGIASIYTAERQAWLRSILPSQLRAVIIVCAMILLILPGMFIRPEWIYAHIALTIALDVALIYLTILASPDNRDEQTGRWSIPMILIVSVVLIVALIRVLSLSYSPAMQVNDEGWLLAWSISLLKDGTFSDRLMYFGGHDVHAYYYGMAAWFKLVGIGYYQGRLFSLMVIAVTILVTGLAARRLFNRQIAVITVLFMVISEVVLVGARVRHDAGLAFSIALSLYLYSIAKQSGDVDRRVLLLYFLSGAAMGTGLLSHYHVVGFSLAMGAGLFLPVYIQQLQRGEWFPAPAIWAYAIGGASGIGLAVLIQIVPQWEGFIATRSSRAPLVVDYFETVLIHIRSIGLHSYIEAGLLFPAIAIGLWQRKLERLQLVLVVILAHLSLGWMASVGWDHYPMPLTPLYALVIATALYDIASWLSSDKDGESHRLAIAMIILLPSTGMTIYPGIIMLRDNLPVIRPQPQVVSWIQEHIPPDALLEGEHFYYHWLFDYDYVSPLTHALMADDLYYEMGEFEGVWSQIPVDFYLLDYNMNTCCVMQRLIDSGFMAERGFEPVYEQSGVVIYGDPDSLMFQD